MYLIFDRRYKIRSYLILMHILLTKFIPFHRHLYIIPFGFNVNKLNILLDIDSKKIVIKSEFN